MSRKRHIVFLKHLQVYADREVCLGAAEYAAERTDWMFDPWPVGADASKHPSLKDLEQVDGILTTEKTHKQIFGTRQTRTPRVLFLTDIIQKGVPSASLDEQAIGRMAVEHLFSRGYSNVAFIGSSDCRWSISRREGFIAAVQEKGGVLSVHELPSEKLPFFWTWDAARRIDTLFQVLNALPKPCGIVAANDVIACFILRSAREQGFRVPEDIGVVGVDDDPLPNAAAGLAISSVRPNFHEVGRQAACLLESIWNGEPVPPRVLVPPVDVVVRASTDVFMTDDPLVGKAQQYIETHRHERLLVDDVIRAVGTNRVTLGRRFKRFLNVGLQEYILNRRIDHASAQLREGKMSVEKIAELSGFSSSSYFYRVFKRVARTSPGQIRAKNNSK